MAVKSSQSLDKLCKFQNSGFCKFQTKCNFKHVLENYKVNGCDLTNCEKRHPKRCRYFYLKRFCKFKEDCQYSHGEVDTSSEEIAVIRLELDKTKRENEQLERETVDLKY